MLLIPTWIKMFVNDEGWMIARLKGKEKTQMKDYLQFFKTKHV